MSSSTITQGSDSMNVRLATMDQVGRPCRPAAHTRRSSRWWALVVVATISTFLTGCTTLLTPLSGVPAHRLPREFFAKPKNNLMPIDISRLRQDPPREYLLAAEDILGIYIEGVLGDAENLPPVHFPEGQSLLPPAIGYPVPIREDGTLSLPLIPPLQVQGLTLPQATDLIRKAYTVDQQILQPGKDRIIVTLIQERTYNVIVIRQDMGSDQRGPMIGRQGRGGMFTERGTLAGGSGEVIKLPAYQNDVLHALAQTGGLPGPDAKNEIKILRGDSMDAQKRDEFVRKFYQQKCEPGPCLCMPPLPEDPAIIRIPLRLPPGVTPSFQPEDIILQDGDIVLIESRETEVFYTGGMLGAGEYQLPRDYDIDVLTALSSVGPGVGASQGGGRGGGGGFGQFGGNAATQLGGVPPGDLFILRKTPCGGQIVINVDMNRAIRDPSARPLIQAGDILILRFKPEEELLNFGLGAGFTYAISQGLRGNN